MPQDRFSGAEANRYGRQRAEQIAAALGAEPMNNASNEYLLDEERVVIKCARTRTTQVGVTYQMLNRLAAVLGAFEQLDGSYRVLRLPARRYATLMKPTRSRDRKSTRLNSSHLVISYA